MCGFAGILGQSPTGSSISDLRSMAKLIEHRGPDAQGEWIDSEQGLFLIHRRLAIIDVTAAGEQPMVSKTGRYVIVFNGEIYNNKELRSEIESNVVVKWNGHSDTETLLHAIESFGLEAAVRKLVGMFAIAVWDRREKRVSLVRDRIGEKPLYFGWTSSSNRRLLFGSEINVIANCADFNKRISLSATQTYLRYGYIVGDQSIYHDVFRVQAGQIVVFNSEGEIVEKRQYWSFVEVAFDSLDNQMPNDNKLVKNAVHQVLTRAVRGQMVSDVPIGAFLSRCYTYQSNFIYFFGFDGFKNIFATKK